MESVPIMPLRVLHRMNHFLKKTKFFHTCPRLRVDVTITSKCLYFNGLFNGGGAVSSLEAKNYNHCENFLSYLGAIVDCAVTVLNPCAI